MAPRARGDEEEDTSSVFVLAVLTTLVVPWTLAKLTSRGQVDEVSSWRRLGFGAASGIASTASARHVPWIKRIGTSRNLVYIALVLVELYLFWVSSSTVEAPFDPHETLGVTSGATTTEIKAAYRKLASGLHPDKNPDPAAHARFILVAKSLAILTNAHERRNYELQQQMRGTIGFALPPFMFDWYIFGPFLVLAACLPIRAVIRSSREGERAQKAEQRAQSLYAATVRDPTSKKKEARATAWNLEWRVFTYCSGRLFMMCSHRFRFLVRTSPSYLTNKNIFRPPPGYTAAPSNFAIRNSTCEF